MDEEFFKQLDEALTDIGADKYWERQIGGHTVWLSPVPFKSQHKINELLTNDELGPNVVGEVKRTTLSYSIVGFDGFDLRPYRDETPRFPIVDHREKKRVKVALHTYLYHKIEDWGTEWIDSAFEVFSDIIESVRKDNLKEVKFENTKDKREELAELEEKVAELRIDLGLPPMVEVKIGEDEEVVKRPVKAKENAEPEPDLETEPFNPFRKIPTEAAPVSRPVPAQAPAPVQAPVQTLPVADSNSIIPGLNASSKSSSTPDRPYVGGANGDVLEKRSEREPMPIEVDKPIRQSVNPRFKRPAG